MKKLYWLFLFCASLLLAGCSSYSHERFADDGKPLERTTISAPFLTKTALENLKTKTVDKRGTNSYSRSVGLESAESRTDTEGVAAIQSLLGKLLLDGLKVAAPIPVP